MATKVGELGLLGYWQREGEVTKPSRTYGSGNVLNGLRGADTLVLAQFVPTGEDLFDLMELDRIAEHENERIFELVQPAPG